MTDATREALRRYSTPGTYDGSQIDGMAKMQEDAFLLADAFRDEHRHELDPPPNTVRVRIAVHVKSKTLWNAFGFSGCSDELHISTNTEGCRITFVEADVFLPTEPETVQGVTT
jgi:hypothetical protein